MQRPLEPQKPVSRQQFRAYPGERTGLGYCAHESPVGWKPWGFFWTNPILRGPAPSPPGLRRVSWCTRVF